MCVGGGGGEGVYVYMCLCVYVVLARPIPDPSSTTHLPANTLRCSSTHSAKVSAPFQVHRPVVAAETILVDSCKVIAAFADSQYDL